MIRRFAAKWSDDDGVNAQAHKDYLDEFGGIFESALIRLINQDINSKKLPTIKGIPTSMLDEVFTEVLEHSHSSANKIGQFRGREEALQSIRDYVTGVSPTGKPLVVCGESGSGRTTLIAKAAQEVSCRFG